MKIKKKAMNKIHNEMRRRFTPYWDMKNRDIRQLQNAVIELRNEVRALKGEPAQAAVQEDVTSDQGKHVAKTEPETVARPAVWVASFHVYGTAAVRTVRYDHLRALKRIGIEMVTTAINGNPQYFRVHLLPTHFPGRIEALEEQLRRVLDAPVRVHWRKVQ